MRRREFISLLGGAVTAWPLAAQAQQATMPVAPPHARIGLLTSNTPEASVPFREALLQGLNDLGYVEGKNLSLLTRYARDNTRQVAPLARELADAGIAVLTILARADELIE